MAGFSQTPKFILRLLHWPPKLVYALGLGAWIGNFVLLLTTIGRKSSLARVTPLQYEIINGKIFLGAALGLKTDWVRNILVNPHVEIRIKSRKFTGTAEAISDKSQIADFLEVRLKRHPEMMGALLRAEGIPFPPVRSALMQHASELTLIVITPDDKLLI